MDVPESIAVYTDEVAAIQSWLDKKTWLNQDEFDAKSSAWQRDQWTRPTTPHAFTEGTIVLPWRGDSLLAILQEMQRSGLVTARKRDCKIEYRLT